MSEEPTTTETIAVCKNCGHTWKLRTEADKPSRRKCSKCQSNDIILTKADAAPAPADAAALTTEDLTQIINTPPEAPPKTNPETPPAENSAETGDPAIPHPGLHPTLIAIGLIALFGIGGIIWFRRRGKKPDKKQTNETPAQPARPINTHRIAGL